MGVNTLCGTWRCRPGGKIDQTPFAIRPRDLHPLPLSPRRRLSAASTHALQDDCRQDSGTFRRINRCQGETRRYVRYWRWVGAIFLYDSTPLPPHDILVVFCFVIMLLYIFQVQFCPHMCCLLAVIYMLISSIIIIGAFIGSCCCRCERVL